MAYERLWYLGLAEHAGLHSGMKVTEKTKEDEAEKIWAEFMGKAVELQPGQHDVTPPALKDILESSIHILPNSHAIHKIVRKAQEVVIQDDPLRTHMIASQELLVSRLPEDGVKSNVCIKIENGPLTLHYLLRWLVSPTLEVSSHQREPVGIIAGSGNPGDLTREVSIGERVGPLIGTTR